MTYNDRISDTSSQQAPTVTAPGAAQEDWSTPISVEDPLTGNLHAVHNSREASETLADSWPDYHGSQFERARHACDEALAGHATEESTRSAFISAAVEAHLHVHD